MQDGEDTMQVALNFIWYHLGIDIHKNFVSTCHRNFPPKHTYAPHCPPIYIKFVRRDLKRDCMRQKFRLRGTNNGLGQQFYLSESLTLFRKNLLADVKKHLPYWQFVWTRNGDIWARRNKNTKPELINTYSVLDSIIEEEGERINAY